MIDNSNITIISHVWIRDPDSDMTILKQRDISRPPVNEEIAPEADTLGDAGSDGNE